MTLPEKPDDTHVEIDLMLHPMFRNVMWRMMYTFYITKGYRVPFTEEMRIERHKLFGW